MEASYGRRSRDSDIRSRDTDDGGGVGGGTAVGPTLVGATAVADQPADAGNVRSRIEALRQSANLVRSIEPPPLRRLTIELARAERQPISEIERLTVYEALWLIRVRREEAIVADRARRSSGVRMRRGARR